MNDAHIRFEHRIGDHDDPISEVIRIEMGSVTDPSEVDVLIGILNAPPGIFDRIRTVSDSEIWIWNLESIASAAGADSPPVA
jgi:hypothetical protein